MMMTVQTTGLVKTINVKIHAEGHQILVAVKQNAMPHFTELFANVQLELQAMHMINAMNVSILIDLIRKERLV